MQNVMKELVPRLISIIIVIMLAWIATNALTHQDEKRWTKSLSIIAKANSKYTNNWLDDKTEIIMQLAEDPRILSVFDDPDDRQPTRSALYEFSEIHGIQNVYVFDLDTVNVLAKRAGAPKLPDEVINYLAVAYDEGWTRIVQIIGEGSFAELLTASVIRGDLGGIIGYAIYMEPLQKALRDMKKALGRNSKVQLSIARVNSKRHAHLIWGINQILPSFRNGGPRDINMPIFSREDNSGTYNDIRGRSTLMAFVEIKNHPHWRAGASITHADIAEEGSITRRLIQGAAALIAFLLLLIPGSGGYSRQLRTGYSVVFPEIFKAPKEGKFEPTVEPIDINSMRAPSSNKMTEKDLPELTEEDLRKISSGTSKAENTPPPKEKESSRSKGFTGESRKEGFGTNSEDLEGLNKKPKLPKTRNKKDDKDPSEGNHVAEYMIRQGIKNNQFKLVYQPIVDINTGKPVMYEVLSRVIDEDGEIIPPNLWLPVARKDNLFQNIDKGVIDIAINQHILSGNLQTPLTFNINGNTFDSLRFMDDIREKIAQSPNLPQLMMFELSSKEIISDKRAMAFTKEHRALGFKFSIDYFGGGADTIKAAKTLKFDFVKIDALRFDINEKSEQKELLILIKTAEKLGIPVIVERVEDAKFFHFIKAAGAPYAQGYYFAEPSETISGSLVL